VVHVCREEQDLAFKALVLSCSYELFAEPLAKVQIQQNKVNRLTLQNAESIVGTGALAHDFEAKSRRKQAGQALAQQLVLNKQ
jgi:hypothetical protein